MLVVKLTIEPGGDPKRGYEIGEIRIGNVSDLADVSDYTVLMRTLPMGAPRWTPWSFFTVSDHRRSDGALALVKRVLDRVLSVGATRASKKEEAPMASVNGPTAACDHGVMFDEVAAKGMSPREVQAHWPRGGFTEEKPCRCGFVGIAYASYAHYISGDW